jgi:hypothetical protein
VTVPVAGAPDAGRPDAARPDAGRPDAGRPGLPPQGARRDTIRFGPDRAAAEARGLEQLVIVGRLIAAGVDRSLTGYLVRRIDGLLDAWGGIADPARRAAVVEDAREAATAATTRVVRHLEEQLALDPDEQWATPLQIARTAVREPTAVLRSIGMPEVVRDEHDERSWPDDVYGLGFATFADLGDDDLAPLHLAWGVAKATVMKARHER